MNNNLQLVLKSSTTEMSLNDHDAGIYIVPELDGLTGLPEIRTTSGVNAGYDGGWTSAQKFDARSIVIRGVIANDDKTEVERMRRELVALLAQGKNEQLELDFVTETGRAYEVQVRTIACDMAMQRVLTQQEFMITLRADDPLIYDNSSTGEEATVNISGATGGFRIPFEIPLAIDAGSEETVVQNSGLESVAPTIKMYGALHNPKIINHTTNQAMQVEAELGFTEGAWTTPVDAPEGTNVSFEPDREAPIESVKLKGNTTQQTYTGKNLLKLPATATANNVTFTNNGDGTFNISTSGTASAHTEFAVVVPLAQSGITGGQSYTVSSNATISSSAINLWVHSCSSIGAWSKTLMTFTSAGTRTAEAPSTDYIKFVIGVESGKTVNFSNVKLQLESGSTVTSFEPYVGGVPAPNPDYPQAVQTVTGENTVKIYGKNLLEMPIVSGSSNGITWTVQDDGSIILNGTSTAGVSIRANNVAIPAVEGETYTLSATGMGEAYNFGYKNSGSGENIFVVTSASPTTTAVVTSTMLSQANRLDMYIQSGKTFNNQRVTLQLEKGSSASSFEIYQGQSYEINLGKNLFDKDNASEVINAYIDTSAHKITTGNNYRTAFIPCEPNTTYTISKTLSARFIMATTSATPANNVSVSQEAAKNSDTAYTITTNSTAKYLCVFCYHSSYDTLTPEQILATLQIEKGSQATSYASYFEPIELCKIGTYQDYIWKDGDTWKVHKEIGYTLHTGNVLGIAANNYSGEATVSATGAFFVWVSNIGLMSENLGTLNSGAISGNADANAMTNGTFATRSGTPDRLYFRNTAYIGKTGNEMKAILAANNGGASVWYALTTPTDTTITNATLIAQLEALVDGDAVVYEGETNIVVTAADGDLPGITAIRYYTDKEPDQRDELIIDSRLKTITLNGLDVYHLKTDGSEFPMLAPGENKLSLQSDIVGDNGYAKVSYKQGYLSI